MERTKWTVNDVLGLSGSYWQCFALHTGVALDVFTHIGSSSLRAEEAAVQLQGDVRGVTALLNALAAMGLLIKREDRYANAPESLSLLVKDSPQYVGHMILHHRHLVPGWMRLDQSVRAGGSTQKPSDTSEAQERESFLMGMFNLAMGIAPALARELDLEGRRHLLDLGGGPGTYAIHFCLEHPALEATVFDLPTTRSFAEETIQRFGVSDRVRFVAGDYLRDEISGRYDVAWLSHVLHSEGPEGCRRILDQAVSALEPGGLLLVHDFILNDTMDGPVFPALFYLNMLVNTPDGRSYSDSQIRDMLAAAGLHNIQRLPFTGPNESGIIKGTR